MPDVVRAPCSVCGRQMRLLRSGLLGVHVGEQKTSAGFRARCDGVGKSPAVEYLTALLKQAEGQPHAS